MQQFCFCLARLCSSVMKDKMFSLNHSVDDVSVILFWCTFCFTTTAFLLFAYNILYLSHSAFFLVHFIFKSSTLLLFSCNTVSISLGFILARHESVLL